MYKQIKTRYPANWKLISAKVVYERANNKCESCGIANGIIIKRLNGPQYRMATNEELNNVNNLKVINRINHFKALKFYGLVQIVLTTAHLDWNENNNELSNLKAKCQKCHRKYDRENNEIRKRHNRWKINDTQLKLRI